LREETKKEWNYSGEKPDRDELQLGALLRIADAAERVSRKYSDIETDRDWYKKRNRELKDTNKHLVRVISSLRGVITRMKRRG
jgi:hypothetical protein